MREALPSLLCALLALWSGVLVVVSWVAVARTLGAGGRTKAMRGGAEKRLRLLLIRPVSGADEWLVEALASVPDAGNAEVSLRLAVATEADEAYPLASIALSRLVAAGLDARLVLTAAVGQNRKAAQLAAVVQKETAPYDLVMVADADVDLAASPVRAMIDAFADERVGAVWAPPIEDAPPTTLGDRASQALLGASLHSFPLLARLDPAGMVGKLCALRRTALEAVGGFEPLVPWLGEDMRLAAALREASVSFVATSEPARSVAHGRSGAAVRARYVRWLTVIRAQRPWLLFSYPLLFCGTFPALAFCLVGCVGEPRLGFVAAALAVARLAVARVAARAARRSPSVLYSLAECFLADGLLAAAFIQVLASPRAVVWKNQRFTYDRRGLLQEAEPPPRVAA